MYIIKEVNVTKLARLFAVLYAITGLIPTFFSLLLTLPRMIGGSYYYAGEIFPLLVIIAIPLICAIAGFIFGIIFGYLYNLLAQRGQGLEVEIEMITDGKKE